MKTADSPPVGRERRRTGPVNRLRRILYGVLLLAAVPVAAMADELAAFGKYRVAPPAPERSALATLDGLLVLRAGADGGPDISLESATARVPQGDTGLAPQFRIGVQRAAGVDGTAFDLAIADIGEFRLSLRSQRSPALSAWSLGGTLEASLASGRAPAAAAVPTLRINDMYGSETRYLAFDASVRQDATEEPRLGFRWRI
ncbi:MAG: hypothetical protein ACRES8_03275 [Nevskiaceae bacterium]